MPQIDPDPIDALYKAWEAKTPVPWSTMRGAEGWVAYEI